jgi:maltose alpha-D-glucosyltransferase/alpha-amylase
MLSNDKNYLKMLQSLLFSFPGSAILIYGDEIGMGENLSLNERDSVRLPMQWNADKNGGFSSADKGYLIDRIPKSGDYTVDRVNVDKSSDNPDSILNFTKELVGLRKDNEILSFGEWETLSNFDQRLFVIAYKKEGKEILIINNLSSDKVDVNFGEILGENAEIQLSDSEYKNSDNTVNPHGYLWIYREI